MAKNSQAPVIRAAKITALQAIIVALISGAATFLVAWIGISKKVEAETHVVTPPKDIQVVSTLPPEEDSAFELSRDVSVFDMRSWREVPASEKNGRYSAVNYINYLHLKKISTADVYHAHYATSGYAIDLRCITHHATIFLADHSTDHPGQKQYDVRVDVKDVPLNQEFLVVIEATYWNAFQNPTVDDASTYTDKDIGKLAELGLIVLLPENKPFKGYKVWDHPNGAPAAEEPYIGGSVYADKDGHFIYWSVLSRHSDYHYRLQWMW